MDADVVSGSWNLTGRYILVMAILVLYLGKFLKSKSGFLQRNNIPASVIGGVLCSIVLSILTGTGLVSINFDMELRDLLLLAFFSSIGLTSKLKSLLHGGKELAIFVVACAIFLIIQNILGVSFSALLGRPPLLGLFGGSIAFAGGHGTAVAWGKMATEAGVAGAAEVGMACATIGLILGGLFGGPVAGRLIRKNNLKPDGDSDGELGPVEETECAPKKYITVDDVIGTLLALGLCLAVGDAVNHYVFSSVIRLPGFLTAMLTGMVISNTAGPLRVKLRPQTIDIIGGVSLQLFLCMSLMSMDLLSLVDSALLLLLVSAVQLAAIILFSTHVVFRMMGRDYDAAVMCGGFIGMGLGATPVAIASMDAVSSRHGPSMKALLVVPLVGAFFIDLINAATISAFMKLPFMN